MLTKNNILPFCFGIITFLPTNAMKLSEVVQHSVLTSPSVLQTVKVCLANEQAYKGAYSGYLPKLDVTGSIGYEHTHSSSTQNAPGGHRTLLRREVGAELRQMLFDGFSTMQNVSRNRFKHNASAWSVSAAANEEALRVAEAYLNVLRQKELVRSARENLKIHQRTSQMIEKRSLSGVSRNTDAVQAKGRLAQASSNLESLKGSEKDAETTFYRVTGLKPKRLSKPRLSPRCMPRTEHNLIDKAIDLHPALRSANSDILEALAQYKEAHSTMMPRIDIVAGARYGRDLDGIKGRNDERKIMLEGRWNLINGGSDFRRRRETAYLTQEAAQIRNNTYRQIIENAKLSWVAYKTNKKLEIDFKKHMDASRETIDAYAKQFQLGQRTLLDLLNSENEYFSSKTAYINTKYDILLSQFRLLSAMGILNEELNIDLSSLGVDSHSLDNITDYPDSLESHRNKDISAKSWREGSHKHRRYADKNHCHECKENRTGKLAKNRNARSYFSRKRSQQKIKNSKVAAYQDNSNYTVQILTTNSKSEARRFAHSSGLDEDISFYLSQSEDGDDRYLVTYGNFSSREEAMEAISDMPRAAKEYRPWVRSDSAMQYAELLAGPGFDNSRMA